MWHPFLEMLGNAGFHNPELHRLEPTFFSVVTGKGSDYLH